MAPRTHRVATKKPNRADNEVCCVTTPPGQKKVGGVLASLSNNVPVKSSKRVVGKNSGRSEAETIDSCNESTLKTPQLPRSVLVGKDDLCSPLTLPRIPKSRDSHKSSDNSMEEDSSVVSYESFSPLPKGRLARKPRVVIDDDENTSSEEDDDETAKMDQEGIDELDPNETILESDASEDQDESEEDIESEAESEEDFESEAEEDVEDSDDCEPDDDEYVPEEDDDSVSDEDLDDYVEEEKQITKNSLRKGQAKEKSTKIAVVAIDSTAQMEQTRVKAQNHKSSNLSVGTSTESPETNEAKTNDAESIDLFGADETAQVEHTPIKARMSNDHSMCLDSPEPEMAIVVDDDDLDGDYDDDILVATIIPDEDEEYEERDEECPHSATLEVHGQSTEAADIICDESCSFIEDDGKNDDTLEERNDKTKTPPGDVDSFIRSGEHDISNATGIKPHVASSRQGVSKSIIVTHNCTPEPKRRNAREPFFRMEGLVKRGKWKLGSKIGVGSFGVVHVGMNNETGTLMAVKTFKVVESVIEDIRREVELMRSLDHHNIVRYLGAQMDKTHLHIFQQWVPGGSVATLLGRFGPFTLQVIRSYLLQTLSGLAYLHENDIMHRDIKGSNILVTDDGVVKLADFGASKKLSNLRGNLMMSLTIRGTPYFMSPEVFEEKYSAKADIWGIGCVAYQMITGCPPWKSQGFTSPISLFNHIKKHAGPPPVEKEHSERLSNEDKNTYSCLCDLLECCFRMDPAARPSASDLLQHTFFIEMHQDADDESIFSKGLFSPADRNASSPASERSPEGDSEIGETPSRPPWSTAPTPPKSLVRSKSVVQWRTTFASPPRQKRSTTKSRQQTPINSSPYHSPEPDTSMWPKWALKEIEKRNLFDETPSSKPIPVKYETALTAMMGSLALSEDSDRPGDSPYLRVSQGGISTTETTVGSKLVGLSFLSEMQAKNTYEI